MNNNYNIFKEDKVLESLGLSNQVLLFLIFDDVKQFPLIYRSKEKVSLLVKEMLEFFKEKAL